MLSVLLAIGLLPRDLVGEGEVQDLGAETFIQGFHVGSRNSATWGILAASWGLRYDARGRSQCQSEALNRAGYMYLTC